MTTKTQKIQQIIIENAPAGKYNEFVEHFLLIPADVVLAVSASDLDLMETTQCLIGTTIREHLSYIGEKYDFDFFQNNHSSETVLKMEEIFGGDYGVWDDIFWGVTDEYDEDYLLIEHAWIARLQIAAELGV